MRVKIKSGFLIMQLCAVIVIGLKCAVYALGAAVIHEMGHFAAIFLLGGRVNELKLGAAGAEIRYTGRMSYKSDFIIAIMGPLANAAAAMLLVQLLPNGGAVDRNLLAGANMIYALVNLVPISITDGGRALTAAVGFFFGVCAAERVIAVLNLFFSLALLFGGILLLWSYGNPSLLICGILITRSVNLKSIMTNGIVEKNKKLFK